MGDVQGCADEFAALIARAERSFGVDHELWLVGDLINRGPASLRVLEIARARVDAGRARVVLGNHEIAWMRLAFGQRKPAHDDTFQSLLAEPDRDDWLDWLRRQPLVQTARIGKREFAMVHAAVAPEWDRDELEARARRIEARLRESREDARRLLAADPRDDPVADDLARLTRCRSVDATGVWSSREPRRAGDAWHERWSARGHAYCVVYGHWSLQGLHVTPHVRGLDTGCVYHGHGRDGYLTAWVPDPLAADPFAVPDTHFWQERARARYWPGPGRTGKIASASTETS